MKYEEWPEDFKKNFKQLMKSTKRARCVELKNKFKKIVTRNGSSIIFEDIVSDEGEGGGGGENPGEKDKLTLKTALDMHNIVLDNEKKIIEVKDDDKGGGKYLRCHERRHRSRHHQGKEGKHPDG